MTEDSEGSERPSFSRKVARHYDELDPFYRDVWGDHLHHGLWRNKGDSVRRATRRLVQIVAEKAEVREGHRVCDVGSGYGGPARFLVRRHGCEVTGITLSSKQLEHARKHGRGAGNPRFVLGDWLDNPFDRDGFDRLISIECVSHVENPPRFFGEARRVLKPGGRLVVCAWLKSGSLSAWQRRWLVDPIRRDGRLSSLSTAAEHRAWMEETGLELRSYEELGKRVRRTWWIAVKRLAKRLLVDPRYRTYLLDSSRGNRGFALSVARIWLAYRCGAMEYGVFTARNPDHGGSRCGCPGPSKGEDRSSPP